MVTTGGNSLPEYSLVVTLDLAERRLDGAARIILPPHPKPRNNIAFALSELFAEPTVEVRGREGPMGSLRLEKKNRPYSRPGWGTNTWTVVLPRAIPAGEPVTLVVKYGGNGTLSSFVFSVDSGIAFAAGQTTAWYPEIEEREAHPAGRLRGLRSTGSLTFNVDSQVVVYTAGRAYAVERAGSRKTLRYRVDRPMYFSFAAGPYLNNGATYYLKSRSSATTDGERAIRVLRVLEREFGPHPFDDFAVVEVPASAADRAGFAGASADGFIMVTAEFLDQPFNTAYYGHEIGHQWFGVTVRPSGTRGIWLLTEAMAQFGSLRAVEALDGPQVAARYRRDEYPGYLGQGGKLYFRTAADGHDQPLADLPLDGEWSRQLANSKGFMAWNALSLELGRDNLRRILTGITRRHSINRITWDQFLRELNEGAGRDLAWFYTQWFDRTGVPDWRIEWPSNTNAGGGFLVQNQPSFRAMVRVDLVSAACPRTTHWVRVDGERTLLPSLDAKCVQPSYVVDPDFEIIHWTPELRSEFGKPGRQ